ncbi:MAG TPA: TetR/AcrR family transcriptional regulator [Spirochaetota bacterium]|nr:TetR/AcrR family transcriptional regulator [Spirochaetota bacterium]HNT10043.1 TetR/AcrR family transcriptional regulator [Spirochaetota bacterium]HNV47781.1 TetR/AcrR family transcriptional regulator [Spirochaetota bacterium]HOS39650.1 TetR/AcrR family transcriptional regulator [Spirochaetota bacterium]HPI23892.1 TetR/AcrR family transcriptional regulator [Spirochaetota bacterium]
MEKIKRKSAKVLDKQERKKNHIIWAAFNAIAKIGYINLTIDEVAKEAGVSKGVVHYYFDTKENLMLEVMFTFVQFFVVSLNFAVSPALAPTERIKGIMRFSMKIALNHKEYIRVIIDYWAQVNINVNLRDIYVFYQNQIIAYIAEIIDQGKAAGEFKEVDSESAAEIILSEIGGFAIRYTWDEAATEETFADKIESLVDTILRIVR